MLIDEGSTHTLLSNNLAKVILAEKIGVLEETINLGVKTINSASSHTSQVLSFKITSITLKGSQFDSVPLHGCTVPGELLELPIYNVD